MSLDYSRAHTLASGAMAASGSAQTLAIIPSKNNYSLVTAIQFYVSTAGGGSSTLKIQSSSTAGSFSSPTDLATITIATEAAGTEFETIVAATSAEIAPGQAVRVQHSTGNTSLAGNFVLIGTNSHD